MNGFDLRRNTGGGTASFPDQTNNSGKVLATNGAEVFWEERYTNSEVNTIIEQNGFGQISLDLMINKPSITYPLTGATNFAGELTSSAYSPVVGFSGILTHAQWQISDMADFSNIVDESYTNNALTWQPDFKLVSTVMYARVRYKSYNYMSEWSDAVSFTTPSAYTQTPVITVRGADTPSVLPYIETSEFVSYNGVDTHVSTSWRVKEGETVIWEDLENTTKKYTIRVPVGVLQPNTTYSFEARHNSETYTDSAWGSLVLTTPVEFDTVPMLVVGTNASPFLHIYNQDVDTFTKLPILTTLPQAALIGVCFDKNDDYLYSMEAQYINVYERIGNTFNLIQRVNAGTSGNTALKLVPENDIIIVSRSTTPYLTAFKKQTDGTLTLLASAFAEIPNNCSDIEISPNGQYLAVSSFYTVPYLHLYKRSGDTFIKLAAPDIGPTAAAATERKSLAWSPDSNYLAWSGRTINERLMIYRRTEDSLIRLPLPTQPTDSPLALKYSKDQQFLFLNDNSVGYMLTYSISGETYTKTAYKFPIQSVSFGFDISPDDKYVARGKNTTSPYIDIFKRNIDDTFTQLANIPAAGSKVYEKGNICFSNTGYPQE